MPDYSKDEIIQRVSELASDQFGGTLATIHADDGTPYPAFVFFHFTEDARVLFGCRPMSQHSMDVQATPQVSFLIDNRNILHRSVDVTPIPESAWHIDNSIVFSQEGSGFDRVVIEGTVVLVESSSDSYADDLSALSAKNWLAGSFARQGGLYCINPRRLTLVEALDSDKHTVDF
tara:strand:- start:1330 stop:1854 length:525 start_codon:yes stop_codon:yes gene_type:complete